MTEPLVSIITPAYNAAKFIGQTIDSVLAQTYTNWEMLIVDDGSIDNTKEIVSVYIEKDNRIKLFSHPGNKNMGVSAARNLAIENSKGDYIALLDSDDLWLPYKLEVQMEQFRENRSVGLVYSKAICIDECNYFLTDTNKYNFPSSLFSGTAGICENILSNVELMLKDTLYMPCLTVVFSRKVLGELRFKENLKYQIEDHFLFTLLAQRQPIFYYDAPLAYYRVHPQSYSSTTNWRLSHMEFLEKIGQFIPSTYHSLIQLELKKRIKGKSEIRKFIGKLKRFLFK